MAGNAGAGAVTAATREALVHGLVEFAKTISASGAHGWIHPDCMAYLCAGACPNVALSPRGFLNSLTKKNGILSRKRDKNFEHEGWQLRISWVNQGKESITLADGTISPLRRIYWFTLAGEPDSSKTSWKKFREWCLDNMEPQPLDNYETVVKALGQISDVINKCPLPLPPVAGVRRGQAGTANLVIGENFP